MNSKIVSLADLDLTSVSENQTDLAVSVITETLKYPSHFRVAIFFSQ